MIDRIPFFDEGLLPLSSPEQQSLLTSGHFFDREKTQIALVGTGSIRFYDVIENQIDTAKTLAVQEKTLRIEAVDLNGDGLDELTIASTQPNKIEVIDVHNQTQNIAIDVDELLRGNRIIDMVVNDINNDGFEDVAAIAFDQTLVLILGGEPVGIQFVDIEAEAVITSMTTGDYDGDGQNDIMMAGLDLDLEQPVLTMLCADETGGFAVTSQVVLPRTFSVNQNFVIDTADMNRDDRPDIVLIDKDKEEVVIYINQSLF